MNILLTIHHELNPNAGAPGTVLKLGQAYQSLGHEVHYLSHNDLPKWLPDVLFPEFVAAYLHQQNVRHRFDVIDASTGDAWVWGTLLRRFAPNHPILVTHSHGLEHSVHLENLEEAKRGNLTLSWKYPLYRGSFLLWEVATSLRCADLVFLLNKQDLTYATEGLGVSPKKAHIVPNGIPNALLNLPFEPLPSTDSSLRIASIGTYISRKGIHYSVPALNRLLARHSHLSISFLGTCCPEAQVHADFDVEVRDRVHVVPRFQHNQLPELLKGHAIKLFVPLSEGFGNALIEAMTCGLAPITTAAPGPLEIVRDGHDAIVIPLRNSEAIEQALERLICDRPYLEKLRHNAYATAQKYSWLNAAKQRLALYTDAIAAQSTPQETPVRQATDMKATAMNATAMNATVIVPTYRRPQDLTRCLQALTQQVHLPAEVIVVVRDEDSDTWSLLDRLKALPLPLKTVTVTIPGVIAAMNAGITAATGDFIAFTDDDAAPHTDWLQRIEAYFLTDDRVGGVGGRDAIQRSEPWFHGERAIVGRLQWHGRLIGEHHRGTGTAREVDVLKGVNMSFRRSVFHDRCFDQRLRGTGAQVHFEVAFCLALKRQGWTLIYDPAIVVDHYIAQRFDEDQRNAFNAIAWANKAHNETVGLLDHLPLTRKIIYLAWAFLVGTRDVLGFVQLCRFLPVEKDLAFRKWLASTQGRWQGIQTWMQPSSQSS